MRAFCLGGFSSGSERDFDNETQNSGVFDQRQVVRDLLDDARGGSKLDDDDRMTVYGIIHLGREGRSVSAIEPDWENKLFQPP